MMQDQNYQEIEKNYNIPLCTKCLYCILKNGKIQKVYCKKGYFKPVELKKALTFTPFDWDCFEYNEV